MNDIAVVDPSSALGDNVEIIQKAFIQINKPIIFFLGLEGY